MLVFCRHNHSPGIVMFFRNYRHKLSRRETIPAAFCGKNRLFGPSDWFRTSGLVVPNHALYHLSYTRIFSFSAVVVKHVVKRRFSGILRKIRSAKTPVFARDCGISDFSVLPGVLHAPKGVRTWCYMCMNCIWPFPLRETCSPALFSPLSPRPPEAVVVKHVVVEKRSRGFAVFAALPGSVVISQLSFIPNLILRSFFLNLVSIEITSSAVSVFGRICRIEN